MSNRTDFVFLCVIYGKQLQESKSLISLTKLNLAGFVPKLVVWNNGPVEIEKHQSFASMLGEVFNDLEFVDEPTNSSLSSIYNRFLDFVGRDVPVCLLDDDSVVPPNFLVSFLASQEKYPGAAVFVPKVVDNGILVSPSYAFGKRVGSVPSGVFFPENDRPRFVASGMTLGNASEKNWRFDERFRFYGADTEFFLRVIRQGGEVVVMDLEIDHSVSTDQTRRQALSDFKFRSLLQSAWIVGGLDKQGWLRHIQFMLWLTLKQSIYRRSFSPFWYLVKIVGFAKNRKRCDEGRASYE